eukprot:7586196-Pyramimonas_sp.AAC.1
MLAPTDVPGLCRHRPLVADRPGCGLARRPPAAVSGRRPPGRTPRRRLRTAACAPSRCACTRRA